MDYMEKTIEKKYVYQGKILSLRNDDALLPNGKVCQREIVEHHGGACVLYVEQDTIPLVRQYRYAYGEYLYEIPAGKLNAGEDAKQAALRELEEETGVRCADLKCLCEMYPSPGYTNEKIYIYFGENGTKKQRHLDEDEFLDVEWFSLAGVQNMIKKGVIKDAKTIIAVQTYILGKV